MVDVQQVTPTLGANNGVGVLVRERILLMTRPAQAARSFVDRLDPALVQAAKVVYAPLIEIAVTRQIPDMGRYTGAIFTSAYGVDAAPQGYDLPAYCVGPRTAQHAAQRGYDVKLTARDADDLVQQIDALTPLGTLVHLCGNHTRGDIALRLSAKGISATECAIYDQPLQPLTTEAQTALAGEVPVILPLFSPRTAAHLGSQIDTAGRAYVIALSRAVVQHLDQTQFASVQIAAQPTGNDMKKHVEKLLRQTSLT